MSINKLIEILDCEGVDEALGKLEELKGHNKEKRLFAVWCARRVQHLMTDERSLKALDVAERYAHGEATDKELAAAREAAKAAWEEAADSAVRSAEKSADAAGAAREAVWAAARAAEKAAWIKAWDAERAAQEAEFRRLFGGKKT